MTEKMESIPSNVWGAKLVKRHPKSDIQYIYIGHPIYKSDIQYIYQASNIYIRHLIYKSDGLKKVSQVNGFQLTDFPPHTNALERFCILHPLPNTKVHTELVHNGEQFLAARRSHTTGRPPILHRGVVERAQLAPAPWYSASKGPPTYTDAT